MSLLHGLLPKMRSVGPYHLSVDCFRYFRAVSELEKHSWVLLCTRLGSPSKSRAHEIMSPGFCFSYNPRCLEERDVHGAQSKDGEGAGSPLAGPGACACALLPPLSARSPSGGSTGSSCKRGMKWPCTENSLPRCCGNYILPRLRSDRGKQAGNLEFHRK